MIPPSWSELSMFFEPVHRALGDELSRRVKGTEDALHDPARVGKHLAELGLFGLLVPPSAGGKTVGDVSGDNAIDVRALCIARETLAYHSPLADSVFAVQGLGSYPMVLVPTAHGRKEFLREVVSGARIGGFALTEPDAGSDVASLKAAARREGGEWVLDGEKVFISNVGIADHFIVFANALPSAGSPTPEAPERRTQTSSETPRAKRPISAFLVGAKAAGLVLEPIKTSGDHPLGRLLMKECRVPDRALLGEIGQGLRLALGTLDVFRTSVGAAAVGMARRALDDTLARVKTRVQFGQRLSDMQLTQAALAEMATELEAARLLVYRAAWRKDRGYRASAEVAMAKLYATEAAHRIIDRAVQLHGGLGVVSGTFVERLYREIRPLRIYEGTSEIQKLIIGASLVSDSPAAKES